MKFNIQILFINLSRLDATVTLRFDEGLLLKGVTTGYGAIYASRDKTVFFQILTVKISRYEMPMFGILQTAFDAVASVSFAPEVDVDERFKILLQLGLQPEEIEVVRKPLMSMDTLVRGGLRDYVPPDPEFEDGT